VTVSVDVPLTAVATPVPDDPESFSAIVAALSSSFGDPTRRAIYLHLREHAGSTASDVAAAHSIHPNVARHHLDRLVAAGHATVTTTPRGVGRPAKAYSVTADSLVDAASTRRDELLVALLEGALEALGPERAEAVALDVGEAFGRRLAAQLGATDGRRSVRDAMTTVAAALTAHGFAARTEEHHGATSVVSDSCPFGEAAAHHPVLCAVDRGLVLGMLDALGARQPAPVVLSSRARGDDDCRAST